MKKLIFIVIAILIIAKLQGGVPPGAMGVGINPPKAMLDVKGEILIDSVRSTPVQNGMIQFKNGEFLFRQNDSWLLLDNHDTTIVNYSINDTTYYIVLNYTNTPPVSPITGAIYALGNSPTGAWNGHAKQIATWNGNAWEYIIPQQGYFFYNVTNGYTYQFRSNAWVRTGGIPILHNGQNISGGVVIGTNNAASLAFETNNIKRGRIDSVGAWYQYNTPMGNIGIDTFVLIENPLTGKISKIGKSSISISSGSGTFNPKIANGLKLYGTDSIGLSNSGTTSTLTRNISLNGYDNTRSIFLTGNGGNNDIGLGINGYSSGFSQGIDITGNSNDYQAIIVNGNNNSLERGAIRIDGYNTNSNGNSLEILTHGKGFYIDSLNIDSSKNYIVTYDENTKKLYRVNRNLISNPIITASNGLTKTSNDIQLGGNMTNHTFIGGNAYQLQATGFSTLDFRAGNGLYQGTSTSSIGVIGGVGMNMNNTWNIAHGNFQLQFDSTKILSASLPTKNINDVDYVIVGKDSSNITNFKRVPISQFSSGGSGGGGGQIAFTKTKAEIDTLIAANELVAGALYEITGVHPTLYDDGTTSGTTVYLRAISGSELEVQGMGKFYNPKYNQSVDGFGIWEDRKSVV